MNHITLKLKSRALGQKSYVSVLLPECPRGEEPGRYYANGKKFRVLWLLHGAGGDHETFLYDDHIADALRGRDVMVVMPYGLNSDYADHMEFANGYAYATHFFNELMPYIYGMFPASPLPADNVIAGYSMGGAGALMLGLYRPELFGAIVPMGSSAREWDFLEPYLDLTGEQFRALASADPRQFPTEYGPPSGGILLKEINMIARYATVRDYVNSMECTIERFKERVLDGTLPKMLFCCGTEDGCMPGVARLRALADELGAQGIEYEFLPGVNHGGASKVIARAIEKLYG